MSIDSLETDAPVVADIWRQGDPTGNRRWVTLRRPLALEAGGVLPDVRMAYETWGTLAADRSNAILVLHGLTGDSHLAGPAGPGHPTSGWWDRLVGPGQALDTSRWFLVVPNVLGGCQGITGPASRAPDGRAWGGRFPFLTIRDQVAAEAALADALGIDCWASVIGGSMGGMRALEWAVTYPDRVGTVIPIACSAASTADQIAWAAPQLQAIWDDPGWRGGDYHDAPAEHGPWRGLGTARRIAHITYRSGPEFTIRFGRTLQTSGDAAAGEANAVDVAAGGDVAAGEVTAADGAAGEVTAADGAAGEVTAGTTSGRDTAAGVGAVGGRYAVESYLDHHAAKLVRRFDAGSYVVLTQAMNSHDVGRGRGGVARALHRVTAPALVIGIDSDRLFPLSQQERLATGLPRSGLVRVVGSRCGHDGFLVEFPQIGALIGDFLFRL
jgi:homoserine O-acetyltransferase/O-succinyltransferase